MSIDNSIPSIIYLLYDAGEVNNINMSEVNDDVPVNDNNEEDLPFYDAENLNKNSTNADKVNNVNDNNEPNEALVVNDNNEPNDALVVNDSNDEDKCNNDDEDVVVVTDGSIVTDPSNYSKKKKNNTIQNSSPSSNLRSSPRKPKLRPTTLDSSPTKSISKKVELQ
jgi:hypothetical protein